MGKVLRRTHGSHVHRARIVETEAYLGLDDPACHVHGGFSPRTEGTWGRPGVACVYTIYGLHQCFNVVTLSRAPYGAVLVRAVEGLPASCCNGAFPREGGRGPGRLARMLGIGRELNGHDLAKAPLELLDDGETVEIASGPRIGITKARSLRLRFAVRGNPFVSSPAPPRFR